MKCTQCQSDLFIGSRHCPSCGMPVSSPPGDGAMMSRSEFFRLALPQKFQSFLHTGIFLCYFSVVVSLISSLWNPLSGMLQAIICLTLAIGLQIAKSVIWAFSSTVLAAATLVICALADSNFVCLITLIGCVFACVGAYALSVFYATYIASGKTPEIGDEEGRTMVQKFKTRRNFRIVTTVVSCLLIGVAAAGSILFYVKGRSADRDYSPGELSADGRYVNDFAGIDLTMPESWRVYSKKDLEIKNVELVGADGQGSVIFFARSPDWTGTVRLDIIRQSSSIYTAENMLESYVESGMMTAEADGGSFSAGDFETLTLGGEEYLSLTTVTSGTDGSEDAPAEIRRTYLCRQIGSYSVIFLIYDESNTLFDDFKGWFAEN